MQLAPSPSRSPAKHSTDQVLFLSPSSSVCPSNLFNHRYYGPLTSDKSLANNLNSSPGIETGIYSESTHKSTEQVQRTVVWLTFNSLSLLLQLCIPPSVELILFLSLWTIENRLNDEPSSTGSLTHLLPHRKCAHTFFCVQVKRGIICRSNKRRAPTDRLFYYTFFHNCTASPFHVYLVSGRVAQQNPLFALFQ